MAKRATQIDVYLEIGEKKTFAVACEWPGWCRSGRNEDSALQALYDCGPRYANLLQHTPLGFHAPSEVSDLVVVERLKGTTTTNFGAPDASLSSDTKPVDDTELARWQTILRVCWQAFDTAVQSAVGHTLTKGARGGGRDLEMITQHVRGVDAAYLSSLGGKVKLNDETETGQAFEQVRTAILNTLTSAVNGEIPARGPRGGLRWTPRYFVRRLAWHELDHVWEIEDRAKL